MRSWLLVVLMVWMPLQLSWAATGSYCAHTTDCSVQHLGRQAHQHLPFDEASATKADAGLDALDFDCCACHTNCSMALQVATTTGSTNVGSTVPSRLRTWSETLLIDRPDRPRWASPA